MANKIVSIHKPNEQQIGVLYDILKPSRTRVYSGVDTFSFEIPYKIENSKTGKFIDNPNLAKLEYNYLIKYDGQFYVITGISKEYDESQGINRTTVKCFGGAYILKYKRVKAFQTGIPANPVKNLTDTVKLLLAGTGYTVGTVPAALDLKYRAIAVSGNKLGALDDICEKWNCVWQDDSLNKRINFIDYQNDGAFLGLYLTENNYLKTLNFDMKEDSIITRLHIYGKDGISVHAVNMGKDYIDDLSFYKTTKYLSQTAIDSLNAYEQAILSSTNSYTDFLNQKSALNPQLLAKEHELDLLFNDTPDGLYNLEKQIDIYNANGEDASALQVQYNNKLTQVNSKQAEIDGIQSQIANIDAQIQSIADSLNINNYLSSQQQADIIPYIIEDEFNDTTITAQITDGNQIQILQELLSEAKTYLSTNSVPHYSATMDVVAFNQLADAEYKIDADKLVLGSVIKVKLKALDVYLDCKIIEISESFDDNKLTIGISNQKDLTSGFTKTTDLLKTASDTANLVAANYDSWNNGGNAGNAITEFLSNSIDTSVHNIKASNNNFELNHRGLVMVDQTTPQYQSILNSNGLIMTGDGGSSWNVAIGKGQVFADRLGGKIVISNEAKFNKIEMYNPTTNELDVEIGNYTSVDGSTQKRGIKLQGTAFEIIGSISPSLNYNNNIIMDGTGLVVTNTNKKYKATLSSTDLKFEGSTDGGTTWNSKLRYDTTNNKLIVNGVIQCDDLQDSNGTSMLSNGKLKTTYIERLEVGTNVSMGANATISWGQIYGQPSIPVLPGYIQSTKITKTSIESPSITGGTITGTTINGVNFYGSKFYGPDEDSAHVEIGMNGNLADFRLIRGSSGGAYPVFSVYDEIGSISLKAGTGSSEPSRFLRSAGSDSYPYNTWDCRYANFTNLKDSSGDWYATRNWVNANSIARFA